MSGMDNSYDNMPTAGEDPGARLKALEESWRWATFDSCDSEQAAGYERDICDLMNQYPYLAEIPETTQIHEHIDETQEKPNSFQIPLHTNDPVFRRDALLTQLESKLNNRKNQPRREHARIPLRTPREIARLDVLKAEMAERLVQMETSRVSAETHATNRPGWQKVMSFIGSKLIGGRPR